LPVRPGDAAEGLEISATSNLDTNLTGPEQLRQQTHIIVETNPAPGKVGSEERAPKEKRQYWNAHWEEWDGLHFDLRRRTLLAEQISGVTNLHTVHLEETRLAGKIGAKIAVDAAAYVTDEDFTGFDDGVQLRRARVYAKGDCLILLPFSYQFEVGYVPHEFYIENSYLEFHNLGFLGTFKGGQFQVPMTLVNYGSSRDMVLMESATPLQALAPGVNAGIQVGRPVLDKRMTWALGLFTDSVGNDFGDATKGFGRVVGRMTGLPIYRHDPESPDTQRLLHLGVSGTVLYAGDGNVRYQSRPESHLAPYVVDTGDVTADGSSVAGLEVAWVNGPLSLQGEYLHAWVWGTDGSDVQFGGGYGMASWFLTGESRPYDRSQGVFSRVVPRRNFDPANGGWGAWEVAGRVSYVNLNSSDVTGGRIWMLMTGINWYLHSHVITRFEYGFGQVDGYTPAGNMNIFQTRIEVDF